MLLRRLPSVTAAGRRLLSSPAFVYQELFESGKDSTKYRKLTSDFVSTVDVS